MQIQMIDDKYSSALRKGHGIVQISCAGSSDIATDLIRYFKTQTIWETPEFRSLAKSDLLFLNQAKQRFKGERFETLLRNWKAARIAEAEIRTEFPARTQERKVYFDTYLVAKQPDFRAKDDEAA
jgi:hypothetical protein